MTRADACGFSRRADGPSPVNLPCLAARRGAAALPADAAGPAHRATGLRLAAFGPGLSAGFRRRGAARPARAAAVGGRLRRRALRRRAGTRRPPAGGDLSAGLLRREPGTLGARSWDVRRAAARLGEHREPTG